MIPRLLLAAVVVGCASAPPAAAPRDPEPVRARAALATVHVDNRSAERVTVLYRLTARGAVEVTVGLVPPHAAMDIAPVPAGEPLVLVARNAAGAELVLAPRAFAIDSEWTWVIAADARFVPPTAGAAR
jgi:hypothetical protein